MSEEFLEAIRLRKGLHPWPSLSIPDVAFPCFIFEAKSDSSVLFFAENQAAGGVAKALKILEGLEREFQEVGGTLEHPLPVIAACTQGALWEVLLGFRIGLEANHCGIVSIGRISASIGSVHLTRSILLASRAALARANDR